MARLNDPPPDPSALDILKRRFTRQNRDLARTNSAQSLRIRNLESEIARLLSENIALREAAIKSQEQAERWRTQSTLGGDVVALKEKLERKLGEVSELVVELGGLPEKAARRKSRDKRTSTGLPKQQVNSPDQKDWRNRQTLSGVLGGSASGMEQEGRLPPIVEDKLYPRKTLEVVEIQQLRDDQAVHDSESPEIGPPPVSSFDAVDRGSWGDTSESPQFQEATILEPDVVQLPSNLETRRKRRTSSLLSDMTPSESESDAQDSRPALFKSGAKRKLDVSELEEPPFAGKENDDFVFQRKPALKPAAGRKSAGRFSRSSGQPQGDIIIPITQPLPQKEPAAERKVLAPKSINSPSKRQVTIDGKDLKSGIADADKPSVTVVRNITAITQPSKPRRQPRPEPPLETKPEPDLLINDPNEPTTDLPPKTPFVSDGILSPISTEPSTKNQSKRVPQEAAIINSVEDVLNGSIGRASRRAKAAVSYAEPNLRDKMRRPGKELVSAVEGIDRKGSREASVGTDFSRSQSENAAAEAGINIEETKEDIQAELTGVSSRERWRKLPMEEVRVKKEEPTSPLSDKKQANADATKEKEAKKHGSRHRTSIIDASGSTGIGQLEKDIRRLSIFDPPSSSPAAEPVQTLPETQPPTPNYEHPSRDTGAVPAPTRTVTATSKRRLPQSQSQPSSSTSRAERRHSMAPSTSALPSHPHSRTSSTSHILGSKSTNAPALQRPSSAASNRSDGLESKSHSVDLKKAVSVAALKSHQTTGVGGGAENGHRNGSVIGDDAAKARADRIASRRRSMMI